MHPPNNKTRRKTKPGQTPPLSVLAGAAFLGLMGGIASAELVYHLNDMPHVGDIVVFRDRQPGFGSFDSRVLAARAGQAGCVLDTQAMRQTGGSLIVEQRWSGQNPQVKVHWSGLRTTSDDQNCGADADLLLRASDVANLAAAVGGFGVVPAPLLTISLMDGPGMP